MLSQELFFSLWSIHGWTLWHLICRADETSLWLNWSGFVSSPLSHDPLLYGSVRGGGNPLEYSALVGLLFASCRPFREDVRLKLFYAWLTSLFHSSASYLLLFSSFIFSFSAQALPRSILKTSHAARREESIRYTVKLLWFLWRSCSWIGILFPVELNCVWNGYHFFFGLKCNECVFRMGKDLRMWKSASLAHFVKSRSWRATMQHSDLQQPVTYFAIRIAAFVI